MNESNRVIERQHRAAAAQSRAPALLLDTFSLFFRAYFAMPDLCSAGGEPRGALYGFSVLLLKLLAEYPRSELCFALDSERPVFRQRGFLPHQAELRPSPTRLVAQLRKLDELLECVGGVTVGVPGYEAGDVLSSLAQQLRAAERPALVVSAARELLQVAHGSVRVHFLGHRGQGAVVYDEALVRTRFGVAPWQLRPAKGRPTLRSDAPLPEPPHCRAPSLANLQALRAWLRWLGFKSLLPRLDALLVVQLLVSEKVQ